MPTQLILGQTHIRKYNHHIGIIFTAGTTQSQFHPIHTRTLTPRAQENICHKVTHHYGNDHVHQSKGNRPGLFGWTQRAHIAPVGHYFRGCLHTYLRTQRTHLRTQRALSANICALSAYFRALSAGCALSAQMFALSAQILALSARRFGAECAAHSAQKLGALSADRCAYLTMSLHT
jgi:hypothetical protein